MAPGGHYSIKGLLRKLVALAKVMRLVELESDRDVDGKDHRPRTRDQIFIHHIDDKSSIDDPSVRLQSGSELERYARSLNGQTDYVTEEFNGYVCATRDQHLFYFIFHFILCYVRILFFTQNMKPIFTQKRN